MLRVSYASRQVCDSNMHSHVIVCLPVWPTCSSYSCVAYLCVVYLMFVVLPYSYSCVVYSYVAYLYVAFVFSCVSSSSILCGVFYLTSSLHRLLTLA